MTAAEHELTVHTVRCERFWLTCSCGWRVDVLSNNWDVWTRIHEQHLREEALPDTRR